MYRACWCYVMAFASILFTQNVSAAVIAIDSSLQIDVVADVDGTFPPFEGPSPQVLGTDLQSQGASLLDLSVSAVAESILADRRVRSTGRANATWSSASSGSLTFDHSLELGPGTLGGSTGGIHGANFTPGTGLFYKFGTDGDSILSIDFDIGLGSFCCSFQTVIDGVFVGHSDFSTGIGSTGTLLFDLVGAGIHTLNITPTSLSALDTIGGDTRFVEQSYGGSFSWRIEAMAVPEPTTIVLLGLGLLGLRAYPNTPAS